jgi:hypothetical protein
MPHFEPVTAQPYAVDVLRRMGTAKIVEAIAMASLGTFVVAFPVTS